MKGGLLRVGLIGAGQITRARHIPGFRALPGVMIQGVCNLHRESTVRVAHEYGIPKIFESWGHLVDDPEIDAIVIGTWPYMHCPITLTALDAGKHVLTQARMAMNAREAQRMLDRSLELQHLTTMVVPSPYGLTCEPFLSKLISDGYLGELRELHVHGLSNSLADPSAPLSWRLMTKYSGFNMLNLGILYETVLRFVPPANRVLAYASKQVPIRPDPETGKKGRVGTPDSVQVITTQEDGSRGVYSLSGVVWHNTGNSIALYGSEGTLIYDMTREVIRGARRQEPDLHVLPVPASLRSGWRVEEDFVAAIRGDRPVTHTTFATGVRYMQFTEAVARSSRHQAPVELPLREFSNPSL
ncbi:MAG TPA: Gfo/Idh/MocA family oxidoreductase [Isosphaeraceae bacterium]|jgi:predicted dehydrogenase|nr:Gfo/Idh/MocA family oxidoreductase [Isosphaeraceae bacterium]